MPMNDVLTSEQLEQRRQSLSRAPVRRQLLEKLPAMNDVNPLPGWIDAPPEVRAASNEVASSLSRHEQAGERLDAAELAVRHAHDADVAAADHAALSGKPPSKPTAPKAEQDLEEASRLFEATHRHAHSAEIALIAAVDATREAWIPRLADDVAARSGHIDRLLVELDGAIKALALARTIEEAVHTAPRPREAIVRHGHAGLGFPSQKALARAGNNKVNELLVELRTQVDGIQDDAWGRKRANDENARRLAAVAGGDSDPDRAAF